MKSTPANTIIETSLVLCDCIREWQDETASTGDGKLDWAAISLKMVDRTGKAVSKLDLQTVWRYIAYGKHFRSNGQEEEEATYSEDEEPFLQPFSAVKRHKIYLSQDRPEGLSMQQRIYLPPSVPDSMDVRTVGRGMKVRHIHLPQLFFPHAMFMMFVHRWISPSISSTSTGAYSRHSTCRLWRWFLAALTCK